MDRRGALTLLAGAAATVAVGCGGAPPVRIAVVWSGWELSRFREVLGLPGAVVFSAGDNIDALLGGPVVPAAIPDMAIVPRGALVTDTAAVSQLRPVPASGPDAWQELLPAGPDGAKRGAWFKVAHKSLVWYRPEALPTSARPAHWEDWVGWCKARARAGRPPLAIGAADGWMLTDWFENVLAGLDRGVYQSLRDRTNLVAWSHVKVRDALTRLANLWSIRGLMPGGGRRALVTQFPDAVLDVFVHGRADMVAAPDFAWPVIAGHAPARAAGCGSDQRTACRVERFRFPGPRHQPAPPVIAGGDVAVALTPAGVRAVRRLVGDGESAPPSPDDTVTRLERWAAKGGFLSLDPRVRYPRVLSGVAADLYEDFEFDLSDRLTGPLAGGDGRGLWRVLTDLFTAVTVDWDDGDAAAGDGAPEEVVTAAVNGAMDALAALAGGSAGP
ncbi:sugar ABC transporter substrate-binding protein [Sphaerisporangium melleum]|uniref:Sugar ABC transporter substrate-binding protein n=1 Tax=Sphaerisporangium melleum TaxID=321316 RepID=A0A917R3I6_9ACTN|nr:hypothetical protein [Sphaerisporangium melleum]GGK85344.1 sugar ABC transporter substrate-binding protein [Sphaerisporangium melleum]GII70529.1 sugar ABC transporter substrate-binding protein [Sphaerisporangium melleum]